MTRFVTLLSGKGGVGKTSTTVNLGHALAAIGKKVVLVDANLQTANLGLHLGVLKPKGTVNHFLRGEKSLREVMHSHKSGFTFIPASTSYMEFQKTNSMKIGKLLTNLDRTCDFVLIDAPSGLGPDLHEVLKHSDEAIVVSTAHLSSIMEAVKCVRLAQARDNFVSGVVLNMTNRGRHEMTMSEVEEALGAKVLANIRHDRKVHKSQHAQVPLGAKYKWGQAKKGYDQLAKFLAMEFDK
jgi:septum site-determining protein MinD